jgi:heme o synthase
VSDFALTSPTLTGARARTRRAREVIGAYVRLTKPRVIELLLVTTVPAMVLAANELPALDLIAAVLVGGTLAAGGANTINCWIERDRDSVMHRTRHRPLPNGEITPQRALYFGLALQVAAFAVLWPAAGILAAVLALSATLFYVFVYTIWLKPRSTQNIVIGGAAGAVPVLVGWAAVTGDLSAPAWLLFALVFFWTPPHFWALAIRYRDDYAAAEIPMLPVVDGIPVAARHILGYSVVVVAVSLGLPLITDVGVLYTATAALLGLGLIVQAVRLCRDPEPARAIRLFGYSNLYLAILFAAVAVDVIIRAG